MAGQSNSFTPITFSALLPLKVNIFTVNMPPTPQTKLDSSSREKEENDTRMGGREEDFASNKEVQGGRGEGNGGPSLSLARQQYLGFCNLFITPEQVEQFHEQYSKGVRDSQEHLFTEIIFTVNVPPPPLNNSPHKTGKSMLFFYI